MKNPAPFLEQRLSPQAAVARPRATLRLACMSIELVRLIEMFFSKGVGKHREKLTSLRVGAALGRHRRNVHILGLGCPRIFPPGMQDGLVSGRVVSPGSSLVR